MREKAIVVANKNERAQVEIKRTSACDGCRGCSVGKEGRPLRVWAKNPINAKVGQVVEIEINAATFLSATLIVYGIPLLAFLAGIGFGYKVSGLLNITSIEPFAILMGIGSMFAGFLGIHLFTKRDEINKRYSSRIVRVSEQ
jgi:sigma-E factor negative regulatory protein RseC